MKAKLLNKFDEAAAASFGRLAVVSSNAQTTIMGTDVGETIDVLVAGKPTKLALVGLAINLEESLAFQSIAPLLPVLKKASTTGIEMKALAWSQRFANVTMEALAKEGISTVELATGAARLFLDGFAYVNSGDHRMYPEAASIQTLMTKRGIDLLKALLAHKNPRITTQSLTEAATQLATAEGRKPVSSSVVHRFIVKLGDLGLIAATGTTGFALTQDGKRQIENAFPQLFGGTEIDPLQTDGTKGEKSGSEKPPQGPDEDDKGDFDAIMTNDQPFS